MIAFTAALTRAENASHGRFDDWPSAAHVLATSAVRLAPELASLLERYDELQGQYARVRELNEKAGKGDGDISLYEKADEVADDANADASEVLDALVALLRKEG